MYNHVPIRARGVILTYNEYKHEVWYVISKDKPEIILFLFSQVLSKYFRVFKSVSF